MFERVNELQKKLPQPTLDDMGWDELRDQHIRNAHRMRAEAFKCIMIAAGDGILALGRSIAGAWKSDRQLGPGTVTGEPAVNVQS